MGAEPTELGTDEQVVVRTKVRPAIRRQQSTFSAAADGENPMAIDIFFEIEGNTNGSAGELHARAGEDAVYRLLAVAVLSAPLA